MSATAFQRKRRELAKKKELKAENNPQDLKKVDDMTVKELEALAKEREIKGYSNMKKEELIEVLSGDIDGKQSNPNKDEE